MYRIYCSLFMMLGFISCRGGNSTSSDGLKTESFNLGGKMAHATMEITVELPIANQGVASDQIRSQLIDLLDNDLATEKYRSGRKRIFPAFEGDRNDSEALVAYYRDKKKEVIARDSQKEFDLYGDENWSMFYSWSLEKAYETDRLIVFNSNGFSHASDMMHAYSFGQGSFTFDKKDGHLVFPVLKQSCENDIQVILRKGLSDYFSVSPEDLSGQLDLEYEYLIPLPSETPQPNQDGLVFHYHQEEISYSAAGEPTFTVSYDDILPYCTQEAVEVFLGDCEDVTADLSDRVKELCQFLPDHGYNETMEEYMTPGLYRAIAEAFSAPDGAYGEIGDNEWLFYFVSGQDGGPVFTVKTVLQSDPKHAIAFVDNRTFYDEGIPLSFFKEHFINLAKEDGKWLLDDFDGVKSKCAEYVQSMRRKYETGEILQYLLSNDYSREYIPEFMESVREFYREFGNGQSKSASSFTQKDNTYSGSLYDDSNSYGIEMSFTEDVSGISGRYRYLSKSADQYLLIYGVRSSDGNLHIFTDKGNELFALQSSNGGSSLTGEWYLYNNAEELFGDSSRYRWKKNLKVSLQAKR